MIINPVLSQQLPLTDTIKWWAVVGGEKNPFSQHGKTILTQVVWGVHTVSAYENFTSQPANHSKTSPLHFFFF